MVTNFISDLKYFPNYRNKFISHFWQFHYTQSKLLVIKLNNVITCPNLQHHNYYAIRLQFNKAKNLLCNFPLLAPQYNNSSVALSIFQQVEAISWISRILIYGISASLAVRVFRYRQRVDDLWLTLNTPLCDTVF